MAILLFQQIISVDAWLLIRFLAVCALNNDQTPNYLHPNNFIFLVKQACFWKRVLNLLLKEMILYKFLTTFYSIDLSEPRKHLCGEGTSFWSLFFLMDEPDPRSTCICFQYSRRCSFIENMVFCLTSTSFSGYSVFF